MNRWVGVTIGSIISLLTLYGVPAQAGDSPEVRNYNGTAYLSGGAGEDERQALQSAATDYTLKIVAALNSGDYVADAQVVIWNARGEKVLDTITEGPWLFAKLPPGVYQVQSVYGGTVRKQMVKIGSSGQTVVMMRWSLDRTP
jgi:hypothetical protein